VERTGNAAMDLIAFLGIAKSINKFNYEIVLLSVLFSCHVEARENRKRGSGLDSFFFRYGKLVIYLNRNRKIEASLIMRLFCCLFFVLMPRGDKREQETRQWS
jgi:hypothetical protein